MITKYMFIILKIPFQFILLMVSPAYFKKTLVNVKIRTHRDSKGGHPHVIIHELDKDYISVGLTTKKSKGKKSKRNNLKLEIDPLGKDRTSYMRRGATKSNKNNYGNEQQGKMTQKDYLAAKYYADKELKK